ncbi:MAG: carbamoyltransferase C-terminal domain-containing protein [Anaerolineales bacterium]
MYTLGINAAFHDPSACLVENGKVIAAAEDERFTHVKHGKRPVPFTTYFLPHHAVDYCLKEAGIKLKDVDHIAYSFNPYLLLEEQQIKDSIELPLEPGASRAATDKDSPWDPLFLSYIVNAPSQLVDGVPHHLQSRFQGARVDGHFSFKWHFVEHHIAHAASAFLPSPFTESAVMTLDGRGEKATTSYIMGKGTSMQPLGQVDMPNSLGILYERLTDYLGFLHSSDEFKVMALASYGEPRYIDDFNEILSVRNDGTFTIKYPLELEARFGSRRQKGDPLEQRHYDIASSLQTALENAVLKLSKWLHDATGSDNLCMAGGVALNCVMNSRLRDRGPFKNIWVQPASGDAGTALGAALWTDLIERDCIGEDMKREYKMDHVFLGPKYNEKEIEDFLKQSMIPYRKLENLCDEVADMLEQGKVIAWFQDRMEFGPRALGSRSLLASPIPQDMKDRLNYIKSREDFRPVAPVVLEEEAQNWFKDVSVSPYMLFVYDVVEDKAEKIPTARHVDGTARVQTIRRDQNPAYYDLVKAFFKRTGVPVLINTSLNTLGEPIVCSPRDAIECFWTSPIEALVIGPYLIVKPENGSQA